MISATEALQRLQAGNERFVQTDPGMAASQLSSPERRAALLAGQEPFAIVLGCSDSRAPAELIFDQGLGDLFVIRVAGNVIAPSLVCSVEFAAEHFGTRLVVVMGHTQCGAVTATLQQLDEPPESRSPNLHAIVDRIRPAVAPLRDAYPDTPPGDLVGRAVRANIAASANQLRHGSRILETLIRDDGLMVVGAEYSLETGQVDFFDGMPG